MKTRCHELASHSKNSRPGRLKRVSSSQRSTVAFPAGVHLRCLIARLITVVERNVEILQRINPQHYPVLNIVAELTKHDLSSRRLNEGISRLTRGGSGQVSHRSARKANARLWYVYHSHRGAVIYPVRQRRKKNSRRLCQR